jgi:hypothetical protein
MLHLLPERYITHYGWFAALLQYVAAGLLSDVTQYAQHAEGAMCSKGLETDTKLWGYDIILDRPDAEGQDRHIHSRPFSTTRTGTRCTTSYTCTPSTLSWALRGWTHCRTNLKLNHPRLPRIWSARLCRSLPSPSSRLDTHTSWSSTAPFAICAGSIRFHYHLREQIVVTAVTAVMPMPMATGNSAHK